MRKVLREDSGAAESNFDDDVCYGSVAVAGIAKKVKNIFYSNDVKMKVFYLWSWVSCFEFRRHVVCHVVAKLFATLRDYLYHYLTFVVWAFYLSFVLYIRDSWFSARNINNMDVCNYLSMFGEQYYINNRKLINFFLCQYLQSHSKITKLAYLFRSRSKW